MKHFLLSLVFLVSAPVPAADDKKPAETPPPPPPASDKSEGKKKDEDEKPGQKVPLKIRTAGELDKLYARRLDVSAGLGSTVAGLVNVFFVSSRIDLGVSIGLSIGGDIDGEKELRSPFPEFYKPTLREFFDALALQTASSWTYKKESQFMTSKDPDEKPDPEPQDTAVIINFEPAKRDKPFQVKVAKGWETHDRGQWMGYIPPAFEVGMDIYEMGTYSAKDKKDEAALFKKVRTEVAIEWARKVKPEAKESELKPSKIGRFEALHFNTPLEMKDGGILRWRHWVFMDGNQCYFIISTIPAAKEKEIYPDVEAMLKTFETKASAPPPSTPPKQPEPKK